MAGIIFAKSSGLNDSLFGKLETPLKMIIEHESNACAKKNGVQKSLFNVEKSKKFGETIVGTSGFDIFKAAAEGAGAENDSIQETYKKFIEHIQFMKEFSITAEMMEDSNYGVAADAKSRAENFTRAYYKTQNKICSSALINGTKTSAQFAGASVDLTVPDGKALFHKAHTFKTEKMKNETQANYFFNNGFSDSGDGIESMLNSLANKMRNFKDENGDVLEYIADTIILPGNRPGLEALVKKVCGSERTTGTANNDINIQYTSSPMTTDKNQVIYIDGIKMTGSVVIPGEVTEIKDRAFQKWVNLTSITIPNGVRRIGQLTFANCRLVDLVLPESINDIDIAAFQNDTALQTITFEGTPTGTISARAFENCPNATDIFVPFSEGEVANDNVKWGAENATIWYNGIRPTQGLYYSISADKTYCTCIGPGEAKDLDIIIPSKYLGIPVKYIDGGAFNCAEITSVVIPNSVIYIGGGAFYECNNLQSVTIGNNVQTINDSSFGYCSSLTSITLPSSITDIMNSAFVGSENLVDIYCDWVQGEKPNVEASQPWGATSATVHYREAAPTEGLEYTLSEDGTHYICSGIGTATDCFNIVIGSEHEGLPVAEIGPSAFSGQHIGSVIIPDGVTGIGEQAFHNCLALERINIPDSVTSVGIDAFSNCDNLQFNEYDNAYYLGNENNPYRLLVRAENRSISSCIVNENTKIIIDGAFEKCSVLTSATIPDGITSIGVAVFYGCSSLTGIIIPDSVTSIGELAFWGCSGLTSVTIGDSVTSIGDSAFEGCSGLTSITIPNSVMYIDANAFTGCENLTLIYCLWEAGDRNVLEENQPWGAHNASVYYNSNSIPDDGYI